MLKDLWPDGCAGDRLPPLGDFDHALLLEIARPEVAVAAVYREPMQTELPAVNSLQEAIAYIHQQRENLEAQRRSAVEKIVRYVPSDFSFKEDGCELVKVLLEVLLKKYVDNPDIDWTFVHKPGLQFALDTLHNQSKSIETLSSIERQFYLGKLTIQEFNFDLYEKVFAASYNPEVIQKLANSLIVSRIVKFFGLNNGKSEVNHTKAGVRFEHKTYFTDIGGSFSSGESSREHSFLVEAVVEILTRDGLKDLATEFMEMKTVFPYWMKFPFEPKSSNGNFSIKAYKNGRVSYTFSDAVGKSIQIFLAKHLNPDN